MMKNYISIKIMASVFLMGLALFPSLVVAQVSAKPELYRSPVVCDKYGRSLAIKQDNSLWGWGDNRPHQGGLIVPGSKDEYYITPVKIADDVLCADNSEFSTFILKTNGELWGWGLNEALGAGPSAGTYGVVSKPVKILDNVVDFKSGLNYNVALKNDGTLWHWGVKGKNQYWDAYTPSLLLENVVALINYE